MECPTTGAGAWLPLSLAQRIDGVCNRFETAWQNASTTAERPILEPYLVGLGGAEHSTLLRELIRLDVFYRQRAGDQPRPADYQERFPELTASWLARALAPSAEPSLAPVPPGPKAPADGPALAGYEV